MWKLAFQSPKKLNWEFLKRIITQVVHAMSGSHITTRPESLSLTSPSLFFVDSGKKSQHGGPWGHQIETVNFFQQSLPRLFNWRQCINDREKIVFQNKFQIRCSFTMTLFFNWCFCFTPLRVRQKHPHFESFSDFFGKPGTSSKKWDFIKQVLNIIFQKNGQILIFLMFVKTKNVKLNLDVKLSD